MKDQLWVLQTKLSQEDSTRHMIEALQAFGLNWAAFPVRPFDAFIPDFKWDGPIIYYGSTSLVTNVYGDPEKRETARLFFDPKMHATSWYGERLGDAWLNHGAEVLTVGDVFRRYPSDEVFFVRPDAGLKAFSGTCDTLKEIRDLLDRARNHKAIDINDRVVLNRPTEISREYRTWIVGGEVVAVVGYKADGRVRSWDIWSNAEYDSISEYAKAQGAKLAELEAFVLDVAVTPEGLRVVEINNIHASGFYTTKPIHDVVGALAAYVAKAPR
jgi:hypothetical protein